MKRTSKEFKDFFGRDWPSNIQSVDIRVKVANGEFNLFLYNPNRVDINPSCNPHDLLNNITGFEKDDLVLVKSREESTWRVRYFSHMSINSYCVFNNGSSSKTCYGPDDVTGYGECLPLEGNEHLCPLN